MCILPILLIIASASKHHRSPAHPIRTPELIVSCIVCGFAQTVYFARAQKLHSAFAHSLQIWNGSLFSLSLATNVVVTVLIAMRVW